jgi:hypothetical protein
MRRMIESAPRDGKFVILEEDARGSHGVARWSSEAGGWVGVNGEPIKITPTHWHPTQAENHLQQGLDFSFFLRRAAEQRATAGDVATGPATGAEVGAQTTPLEAKCVSQARWRFAAILLAAILVAAAFTGMYFSSEVTYEGVQLRKAADDKAAELQQERDHSAALASELARVRRDFDATAALLSKAADEEAQLRNVADAKATELQQERDHSAALASDLASVRRDFDTIAALLSKAGEEGTQLRNVADAKMTELQQERDHSAALASELASVRRDFDTLASLSKAADKGAQLRKVADAMAALRQEPDYTAALQSRAPASGAPVAAPPARRLDPDELATLITRAKILVAAGDISPARLLLERAAEAQDPAAALMLARTYDPDVLRAENVRNILPDPAMARIWYHRAAQLGSEDAQRRLSQLQ